MTTPTVFLPIDLTGEDPDNFISGEYHKVANGPYAIIRPHFGDFYTEGLQLFGASAQDALTLMRHGEDYVFGHFNEQASAAGAGEVYQVILVRDTRFFTTFRLSYHVFGGEVRSINYARLWNEYLKVKGGAPTPWANLTQVPKFFDPESHVHDAKDLYGLEYITQALERIEEAITTSRGNSAKWLDIRYAMRQFEAERRVGDTALPAAVRKHIDGVDFAHTYTKAMVGLGNLANYAFTPMLYEGDLQPAYGSPETIRYWLEHLPEEDIPAHVGLTNNPHGTTKAKIGLEDVANYDIVVDYTAGDYEDLLDPDSDTVYLGPAAFAGCVTEYSEEVYTTVSQPLIDDAVVEANATLASATTIRNSATTLMTTVNTQVSQLQENAIEVERKATQASAGNNRFNIVYGNAVYSHTVRHLLFYDHQQVIKGQEVYPGGFYPVPERFDGLELWLESANPVNKLFMDPTDKLRVVEMHDRSRHKRVWTAPAHTAPILQDSQDVVNLDPGITHGKVMLFTPGLCMDQSFGAPVKIKAGMTVIALMRSGAAGSRFSLLHAPNAAQETGIFGFTPTQQALAVRSGGLWKPLEAPANSALPQSSQIVVGVISEASEAFCWLACTKAINYITYPRGLNTPASSWPAGAVQTDALTQIGNANFAIDNAGEFGALVLMDRPIWAPEVKAIVDYLRLRYTDMTALAVDYVALNAF